MTLWANGVMRNSDKSTLPSVVDFQTPPMWRVNPFSVDHVRVNNLSMSIRWSALFSTSTRNIYRYNSTSPKNRVKRVYSDLPEVYFLPDGTPAEPLGEWSNSSSCSMFNSLLRSYKYGVYLSFQIL